MGSATSVSQSGQQIKSLMQVSLKKLPDSIEEALYVHEKFPIIIDHTEQASRFLKYQLGSFFNMDDITITKQKLNRALVSAMQYGRTLTLKFNSFKIDEVENKYFDSNLFPKELLFRSLFYEKELWKNVLNSSLGDPDPNEFTISYEFAFIICICDKEISLPDVLHDIMHVFEVIDTSPNSSNNNNQSPQDPNEEIASLYNATEIIRNSLQLVECAFDGDFEGMKQWIDKGYHIESTDGRKHTALSEAAVQGHSEIVSYLLTAGADPNKRGDTGRTALWRAAFNGHLEVVKLLLEAGGDPDCQDTVSMEAAYDVTQSNEIKVILSEWDRKTTENLINIRNQVVRRKLEELITTAAAREQYAREIIRKELIAKVESGDVEGLKEMLLMIANEAEKTETAPRGTVECRNDSGQSLLSIATQLDNDDMATFLLTYWKELLEDQYDDNIPSDCSTSYTTSKTTKVFKANPNSRDMKGWTCVCIAIFHDSKRVLPILLEYGGDPSIRSSYNKNAWDLAKDEVDAAEHVTRSRADIRQILLNHEQSTASAAGRTSLFGRRNSSALASDRQSCSLYKDLGPNGSPIVMLIEMNNENSNNTSCPTISPVAVANKKINKTNKAEKKIIKKVPKKK